MKPFERRTVVDSDDSEFVGYDRVMKLLGSIFVMIGRGTRDANKVADILCWNYYSGHARQMGPPAPYTGDPYKNLLEAWDRVWGIQYVQLRPKGIARVLQMIVDGSVVRRLPVKTFPITATGESEDRSYPKGSPFGDGCLEGDLSMWKSHPAPQTDYTVDQVVGDGRYFDFYPTTPKALQPLIFQWEQVAAFYGDRDSYRRDVSYGHFLITKNGDRVAKNLKNVYVVSTGLLSGYHTARIDPFYHNCVLRAGNKIVLPAE